MLLADTVDAAGYGGCCWYELVLLDTEDADTADMEDGADTEAS